MSKMITHEGTLIRINPSNNHIEYSPNRGVSWLTRYTGSSCGVFRDLLEFDGQIYACTDKGVYYSPNKGTSWLCKSSSMAARSFETLQDGTREILASTSDGHLYYSTNKGVSWLRRH